VMEFRSVRRYLLGEPCTMRTGALIRPLDEVSEAGPTTTATKSVKLLAKYDDAPLLQGDGTRPLDAGRRLLQPRRPRGSAPTHQNEFSLSPTHNARQPRYKEAEQYKARNLKTGEDQCENDGRTSEEPILRTAGSDRR